MLQHRNSLCNDFYDPLIIMSDFHTIMLENILCAFCKKKVKKYTAQK